MILREADDETYAAPVARVETTTIIGSASGERVVDRSVRRGAEPTPAVPLDMSWPEEAMFPYGRYLFPVPRDAVRVVRHFDHSHRLQRAEFFDRSNGIVSNIAVEHDAHGRVVRVVQMNGDDRAAEVAFSYDDERRRIESTLSLYGMWVSTNVRTLDERGLVTREEETTVHGGSRDVVYAYAFNERGDWVERTARVAGTKDPVTVTWREIEYASPG